MENAHGMTDHEILEMIQALTQLALFGDIHPKMKRKLSARMIELAVRFAQMPDHY